MSDFRGQLVLQMFQMEFKHKKKETKQVKTNKTSDFNFMVVYSSWELEKQ